MIEPTKAKTMLDKLDRDEYEILTNALSFAWVMAKRGMPHSKTVPATLLRMGEEYEEYWLSIQDKRGVNFELELDNWLTAKEVSDRMEES